MQHTVVTDVGVVRKTNQDDFLFNSIERLYAVCDGMGGHKGGEQASRTACEAMERFVVETRAGHMTELPFPYDGDLSREANRLKMAVRWANRRVWEMAASNPVVAGMGTTVVAVLQEGRDVHLAHVGDSRIYRVRNERLQLLTRDHSYVNELLDAGDISQEAAAVHPERNAIARAVGTEETVDVELLTERWKDDDLLLLCSDGLWDQVSEHRILEVLVEARDPEKGGLRLDWAARELVRLSNNAGGVDNVTVMFLSADD